VKPVKRPPRLTAAIVRRLAAELEARRAGAGLRAFVMTAADIPEVAAMSATAFGEEALTPAKLRFYLERAHALAIGLRRRQTIVSYTLVELNRGQRRVYVVETCTRAGEQGRGHASWLRARMAAIAYRLGYRTQTTHVRLSNTAAQELNRRAGMVLVREIAEYYDDGETGLYLARPLTAADDA
jgi:ribosomal protein S18 acetylase RimI-like enzyme